MQQHDGAGKPCSINNPYLVDNVYQGYNTETISETLNLVAYEKDAAGVTVVVPLKSRRIFDCTGGKLGSYWGDEENLQYTTPITDPNGNTPSTTISAVVLTDAAAAVAIYDATYDLEKIFESQNKGRYVLKLTNMSGQAYYGWIEGVAVASNVYTFDIYDTPGFGAQTWVKTWGDAVAATDVWKMAEIFEYSTSVVFGDTDTIKEELPYSEYATDYNQLKSLEDGQFRIDYRRGRVLLRKLDADDTETVTYTGLKSGDAAADVDIVKLGGVAVPIEDAAVVATGIHPLWESKIMDGAALPNQTNEGDAARPAVTLAGIPFGFMTNLQGTGTPAIDHSTTIANGLGLTTLMQGYEAKDYDGSALPNPVTEGKAIRAAGTLSGVAYTLIVNKDGSLAALPIADDAADSGGSLKTGGVYNATESTLDDGDRGDTQLDAEGYTKVRSKAYDTSSQGDRMYNMAPDYTHNVPDTLASVSNETSATNYYYLDMAGYKYFSIQVETSDATPVDTLTVTIEATCLNDGTAQASCTYQDVTSELFSVASWVDTDFMAIMDTPFQPKYVRVKTVTAGGSNDADYKIYARRY